MTKEGIYEFIRVRLGEIVKIIKYIQLSSKLIVCLTAFYCYIVYFVLKFIYII